MVDPLNIPLWTAIMIGIGALMILEVLFLLARRVEGEQSLHRLRVRSHSLRLEMKHAAADQMYDEMRWEMKRTGKSWDEIVEKRMRGVGRSGPFGMAGTSRIVNAEPDLTSPRPEDVAIIVDDDHDGTAKQAA